MSETVHPATAATEIPLSGEGNRVVADEVEGGPIVRAATPCGKDRPLITIRLSRKLFFVLAAVGALVVTGILFAAWSTGGSGNGYAKAGSASALTIGDASASTTADLYPGATGAVKLKVTNPNSFPVRITAVTKQAASITSDKGAACNASTGVTFTDQSGLTLDLAAGATSTFTLSGAVSMTNASDNTCQGAVFTIPVDVTAISNA
jgi:hypothetical protein